MQTITTLAPWFEEWFDSAYYHLLYQHRDETEAAGFINRLLVKLRPAAGSKMLDLGCDSGRHSVYLAQKGYDVTGYDLSLNSILKAKTFATESLRFAQKDMRDYLGFEVYDYLFSFFTSFGYFTEEDNQRVMANMATALKPGGCLVLDYLNKHTALKGLVRQEQLQREGVRFFIRRWADDLFLYKHISIEDGSGRPLSFTEKVRLFDGQILKRMFAEHGLVLKATYGSYELETFRSQQSKRLILFFEKER